MLVLNAQADALLALVLPTVLLVHQGQHLPYNLYLQLVTVLLVYLLAASVSAQLQLVLLVLLDTHLMVGIASPISTLASSFL